MFALVGCGKQEAAVKPVPLPFQPKATLEEVMHHMVIPNAEVVWKSTGSVVTKEGVKEFKPSNDDQWFEVENSATVLTEAGNLLMMEPRAKDNGKWIERCKALVEAGDGVRKAARDKNVEALFVGGSVLFDSCQGCHFEYRFTTKDPGTFRSH